MDCAGAGDQIDDAVETGVRLRRQERIVNIGRVDRRRELAGIGVGRAHAAKPFRQRRRRLSAAGSAIPREVAAINLRGEEVEERIGICRPKSAVVLRDSPEMAIIDVGGHEPGSLTSG